MHASIERLSFPWRLSLVLAAALVAGGGAGAVNAQTCPSGFLCVGPGQRYTTIQAAADAATAGNTVLVFSGTYAGFHSVRSGAAGSPITFKANSGDVVINSRNANTTDNINIENTDYIVVDGFRVQNAARAGIRVVTATGVVVQNNVVRNSNNWGIFSGFTPRIQVLGNTISGTVQQHGIYVSNSSSPTDNPVIRGNESYGNNQNGIQLNGDCQTRDNNGQTDGVISGAVIERNKVHDNRNNGFALISVDTSTVRNNLVYNNGSNGGAGGIHLTDEGSCGRPSSNNVVVNNTVVEPRIGGMRMTAGATANIIFNNIVIASRGIADEVGGNSIDAASNLQRSSSTGVFVNPSTGDYRLAAGSPAVDTGKVTYSGQTAPANDFEGNARPGGSSYDLGAYEQGSGACATTLSPASASYAANGGSGNVIVASGGGCNWSAGSNAAWITILGGASGSGSGTVSYAVAANTGTAARTGTLTIAGQGFTVSQAGMSCSYSLSPSSASYASGGGTGSATVTAAAGCGWTVTSTAAWITIAGSATRSGSGTISYSVAANPSTASRTASLTAGGMTLRVSQSGAAGIPTGASTIWPASTTPANIATDTRAVELGVKFRSDVSGKIIGIRFYKGAGNTGTHTGSLWTTGGKLLATGTFTNESATGWQQLIFSTPVAITANTVYVASYHTNVGRYAYSAGYFATRGADNPPLHALAFGTSGPNGVYVYSSGGTFPTQSYGNTANYWVDVLFTR